MTDCQFKSEYRIIANENDIRSEWVEFILDMIEFVRVQVSM